MARIYGETRNIDLKANKEFWEKRTGKYNEEHPYVTIKLNDNNPNFADMADEYEKKHILPMLNINPDSYILDIGCGMGRLAEAVIDDCRYYLGTDMSEGLIELARKRIHTETEFDFLVQAFQELNPSDEKLKYAGKYNRVIIAGVFLFINDAEVTQCLENLLSLLDEHAVIYISAPIALKERLTLVDWKSEDFDEKYNAIYRTIDEYIDLYQPLFDQGFTIRLQDFFSKELQTRSETARHYFILER